MIANHDLLLRWPADYPAFEHVVVDEVHELAEVADEAYAVDVRPDEVLERFDEVFGRPRPGGARARRGEALLGGGAAGERKRTSSPGGARSPSTSRASAAPSPTAPATSATCSSRTRPAPSSRRRRRSPSAAAARIDAAADHAERERERAGENAPTLERALAELAGLGGGAAARVLLRAARLRRGLRGRSRRPSTAGASSSARCRRRTPSTRA